MARPERRHVAVVGGGILGVATTRELARRGVDAVCLEQAAIGGPASGSKGETRLFRLSYDDPLYSSLAVDALDRWAALEREVGAVLLDRCGLLSFGGDLDRLQTVLTGEAAKRASGGPERLGAREIARRVPGLLVETEAIFDPDAAVLRSAQILTALATDPAVDIRQGVEITGLQDRTGLVRMTSESEAIEAEVVVVCAGSASRSLVEGAGVSCPLRASLEQVAYFSALDPARRLAGPPSTRDPGDLGAGLSSGGLPAVVERAGARPSRPSTERTDDDDEGIVCYGLPVAGDGSYKLGLHGAGPPVTPGELADAGSAGSDPEMTESLSRHGAALLEGIDPVALRQERCLYDNSPDGDFVVDRVGRVVVGAGTSGHGFKFALTLAALLADLALGVRKAGSLERFALSRPAMTGRAGVQSART